MYLVRKTLARYWLPLLFLLFYLLFTVATYRDFGITWDEPTEYVRGAALYDHFAGTSYETELKSQLFDAGDGHLYNHFYAAFLFGLIRRFDFSLFHFLNMLFASIIFVVVIKLFWDLYRNQLYAIVPGVFFLLTPPLLGHIPGNPKDMPFAVFYFCGLAAMWYFFRGRQTWVKLIFLGLIFGFALASRTLGASLLPIFVLYATYVYFSKTKQERESKARFIGQSAFFLLVIGFISLSFVVLTWPYLAADIFNHGREILTFATRFPSEKTMLFDSEIISNLQLPMRYIPVWVLITTPIFILCFFFTSILFIKKKRQNSFFVLLIITLGVNIAIYLIIKPTLYDGLRQYLFILPIIATIAALSFVEFVKMARLTIWRRGVLLIAAVNMIVVAATMIRLHPYEYIYFNEFIGGLRGADQRFETEYWGASYQEAVAWLVQNQISDQNLTYKIKVCGNPFASSYYFPDNLQLTDSLDEADYFLCFTRGEAHRGVDDSKTIQVIAREGVPLNYIKKLR